MVDLNKSIFENSKSRPLICAHRGVSSGNIPCNTIPAFNAALIQNADIIELDITKSSDGEFYVFHPGMEKAQLHSRRLISTMKSTSVSKLRYVNQDDTKTQFCVEKLENVFDFLKGKCYINVDKFWTDIPGISSVIKKCGVEKQVIVKTEIKNCYMQQIIEYAKDFMFMPIVKGTDNVTDMLADKGINCIGAEVLFSDDKDFCCSKEYIDSMHKKGMILFVNAEVYNYKSVISANHNDDTAFSKSLYDGWGWLIDRGFDIIQTDWCGVLSNYIAEYSKK